MPKELKSGYTTGTHATAVFAAVLYEYFFDKKLQNIEIELPNKEILTKANIDVRYISKYHYSTIKVDNDDLDVTKGCCIKAKLFLSPPKDIKKQIASKIKLKNSDIFIYAGDGVGVVTKAGLKINPNYPAINPTPLKMMEQIADKIIVDDKKNSLHILFSVDDGENIAKDTANKKVGVVGGISILGTRGVVKPISADAYLDSISAEISVADASHFQEIVFTLGNRAFDYANKNYKETQVIEVGNFVYDSIDILKDKRFKKLVFISSVAKMSKVAQGCKNTHNRFGGIDFDLIKNWLDESLKIDLKDEDFITLKGVLQILTPKQQKEFVSVLNEKASFVFKRWLIELKIDIQNIDIITLLDDDVIKKGLKW
jgi:cobalt-precorrin-5B (C1)-methyltransferase